MDALYRCGPVARGQSHGPAVGLDAGKLKRLLRAADPRRQKAPRPPRFVELIAPAAVSPECVIEFESATGSKMRIHWKIAAAPDWANLLRAWRAFER